MRIIARFPLRKWVTLGLAVAMGSAVPDIAAAQSTTERIQELERRLEQSLKTIEELATRVKELEARTVPRAEPARPPPRSRNTTREGSTGLRPRPSTSYDPQRVCRCRRKFLGTP